MKTTLALIVTTVLASSNCLAAGFHMGPHAGHQNLKMHFKETQSQTFGYQYNEESMLWEQTTTSEHEGGSTSTYNTNVQGLNLGYDFGSFSLLSSLDFARYFPATNVQLDFTRWSVGGRYNIIQLGQARIHAGAGVSYGQVKMKAKDIHDSGEYMTLDAEFKIDPMTVVNYDLSLGTTVALTEKLDLAVDYRYSDALRPTTARIRSKVRGNYFGLPLDSDGVGKSTKGSFTTQEMTVGLLWSI